MKRVIKFAVICCIGVFSAVIVGCGGPEPRQKDSGRILVTMNDSSLMIEDVVRMIPSGISETDSTELFLRLVERWIESRVLEDVAEENVMDISRIDRMVEDYRNKLIIEEYLRNMEETARTEVKEKDIRGYYERHGAELLLEAPLIKGIYLKTSEKDEQLPNLRKWMEVADDESVDNIEKYGMREAMKYEYFGDRWIDWSVVAEQIPYRFYDADAFLSTTRDFETSYGGSVYLLHITDYLPSGEKMPYEYASDRIAGIMSDRNSVQYRENLKRSLYRRAIREEKLKGGRYDPIKGRMRDDKEIKKTDKNKRT